MASSFDKSTSSQARHVLERATGVLGRSTRFEQEGAKGGPGTQRGEAETLNCTKMSRNGTSARTNPEPGDGAGPAFVSEPNTWVSIGWRDSAPTLAFEEKLLVRAMGTNVMSLRQESAARAHYLPPGSWHSRQ